MPKFINVIHKYKILIFFTFLIGLWHLLVRMKFINLFFFPSPYDVVSTLLSLLYKGNLLNELGASTLRLFVGMLISAPLAYLSAIFISRFKSMSSLFEPIINFLYPIPKIAIFPILLLIFGIGDKSKILMISFGTYFLLFINLKNGIISLMNSRLSLVDKIYHFKKFDYYFNFIFKGTLRSFFIGLQTSFNYGLTLMLVSEYNISNNGIGHFIWSSWEQFRVIEMYAAILLISIIGLFFNLFFNDIINKKYEGRF